MPARRNGWVTLFAHWIDEFYKLVGIEASPMLFAQRARTSSTTGNLKRSKTNGNHKDPYAGIGIPPLQANLPPIVKRNYGKWVSHEHPRPGVIKHDSETGEACYTVRAGMPPNARVSTPTLRKLCDIADQFSEGYFRITQRNSFEFVGWLRSGLTSLSRGWRNRDSGRGHQPFFAQHHLLHRLHPLPPCGLGSGGHHEGCVGHAAQRIYHRLPPGQTQDLRFRLHQ